MSRTSRARIAAAFGVVVLGLAACGNDDGGQVRDLNEGSGSAPGSASGSGTHASGSASGSGTHASGTEAAAACVEVGDPASADTTVVAVLGEYVIGLDTDEVPAGTVAFAADNQGADVHEIVVARTDLAADALPTAEDGTVDEDALGAGAVIGEIEAFAAGTECAGAFDLEPGSYVLFCNVVSEGGHAHYEEGMTTSLTVT